MGHYVDLHCHLLPGLDDGAKTPDQSRNLLRLLSAVGFGTICATPHQKAAQYLPSMERIDQAYADTLAEVAAMGGLTLLRGCENFWDEVFHTRCQNREIPCYTGGKAFLVEIAPELVPLRFAEQLFAIRARGTLPVLAHPERYGGLTVDLARAEAVGKTAALVVDLGALDGAHGWGISRAARKLVLEGLAHAAASDAHTEEDVRAVAAGIAWIERKLGPAIKKRMLEENPRRILQGELPD